MHALYTAGTLTLPVVRSWMKFDLYSEEEGEEKEILII